MKKIKLILPILGLMFAIACGGREEGRKAEPTTGIPLRVAKVEKLPRLVDVSGAVRAADVAELAGRSAGFITRVPARVGLSVRKGELLVLMDDRNLRAQQEKLEAARQEAELGVREAEQHLVAADAQNGFAASTFNRFRALYEKQAASRQEFDEAESRARAAEASFRSAQERIAQAQARKKQVESDLQDLGASLDYVRIVAPFDGVITAVHADRGTFAGPGQPLVIMENPSSYQVVFSVEEELLGAVQEGAAVQVLVPAVSNQPVKAEIAEVSPLIVSATRTFQVKADLPRNRAFKSGLSATVQIGLADRPSLWIPAEYLSRARDVETVMVRENNNWRKVLVKSGRERLDRVEILSGLRESDEVGLFEGDE
jgi:multidrug efflux pump subunit AcrA (membrane-fusion protein)